MGIENIYYKPPPEKRNYRISLLVDNPDAWIIPWAKQLLYILRQYNEVLLVHDPADLEQGDFAFFLGCTKIVPTRYLSLHRLNLVVHESALPEGKGFSPVAWQVLEGCNSIPVVLFEALESLDAGDIHLKDSIELTGYELLPEIRQKQGQKTLEMIVRFLESWPDIQPEPQKGVKTVYRRRSREDDCLDPDKTIREQFNKLRVVDNEGYPAWFEIGHKKYVIKIYSIDEP